MSHNLPARPAAAKRPEVLNERTHLMALATAAPAARMLAFTGWITDKPALKIERLPIVLIETRIIGHWFRWNRETDYNLYSTLAELLVAGYEFSNEETVHTPLVVSPKSGELIPVNEWCEQSKFCRIKVCTWPAAHDDIQFASIGYAVRNELLAAS